MINTSPLPYMNMIQGDFCYKVKGKTGVNNFSMGPNSRVPLFDEDNNIFFIKITDANGEATSRMFSYEEITDEEYPDKYLTVDKFNKYMSDLREEILNAQLDLQRTVQSIAESNNSANNSQRSSTGNSSSNSGPGSAKQASANKRRYGNGDN